MELIRRSELDLAETSSYLSIIFKINDIKLLWAKFGCFGIVKKEFFEILVEALELWLLLIGI